MGNGIRATEHEREEKKARLCLSTIEFYKEHILHNAKANKL